MTDERKDDPPTDGNRARHAAENPVNTAETPATGKERMVLRRFSVPVVLGVIAVVVLLVLVLV